MENPSNSLELLENEESQCRKPCNPDNCCEECCEYWNRMIFEGYWDENNHKWTTKGWQEITKL